MLRYAVSATVTLVWSALSHAQGLPRLHPPGMCRQRWTKAGVLGNEMNAYCVNQEQVAYEGLKLTWPSMPGNVRCMCIGRLGKPVGSTYEMLQHYATEQMQAERQNLSSTFRW